MSIVSAIAWVFRKKMLGQLPACVRSLAVAWYKDLRSLKIGGTSTVIDVVDWDGVNDLVTLSSIPDVTGDKTLTFNAYIKSSAPTGGTVRVLSAVDDQNDCFCVSMFRQDGGVFGDFLIMVAVDSTAIYGRSTNLASYFNRDIEISVVKSAGAFVSISIDGTPLTFVADGVIALTYPDQSYIGALNDNGTLFYSNSDEVGYFWDVRLYDGATLTHEWLGYPGNINPSWEDSVGTIDGTLSGTPTTDSITIAGTSTYVEDAIGEDTRNIYYGQYLISGTIDFNRTSGTFDYTDPSDGSLVEDAAIPSDGLYAIPVNGICEVVTSDGSRYPVCERAGNVLHDVFENSTHISVTTPVWGETLYGSDYLNQQGYITKADSDALSYLWETEVDGTPITLNDDCLVPLSQWTYVQLYDVNDEPIYDENDESILVKENI